MARKVSPVPKGYHTATPVLVVRNAAAAVEFYKTVFEAAELSRSYAADGITIIRAELKIGNSIFHISDEMPAYGIMSPVSLGGVANANHLYLANVDAIWQRAEENGVTVVLPIEDAFWGERYGKFIDPFGHAWSVAKRLEIVSAEEITERAEKLLHANFDEEVQVVDIAKALESQEAETGLQSEEIAQAV